MNVRLSKTAILVKGPQAPFTLALGKRGATATGGFHPSLW
jgi:hypothetical protein